MNEQSESVGSQIRMLLFDMRRPLSQIAAYSKMMEHLIRSDEGDVDVNELRKCLDGIWDGIDLYAELDDSWRLWSKLVSPDRKLAYIVETKIVDLIPRWIRGREVYVNIYDEDKTVIWAEGSLLGNAIRVLLSRNTGLWFGIKEVYIDADHKDDGMVWISISGQVNDRDKRTHIKLASNDNLHHPVTMMRKVVELHHGQFKAEQTDDALIFTIELPINQPEASAE